MLSFFGWVYYKNYCNYFLLHGIGFLLYRNDSGTGHPHRESYLISSRMPIVLVSQPRPIPISLPLVPEECMPDEDSLAVKDASLKQEGVCGQW